MLSALFGPQDSAGCRRGGSLRHSPGPDAPRSTCARWNAHYIAFAAATKLIIHFADCPGHGREYWDSPGPSGDSLPDGDPSGETCEQYLRQLARQGVDFHFAKIAPYTDKMIRIWKRVVFDGNDACFFEEHDVRTPSPPRLGASYAAISDARL